jgi:hypothetical protein
MSTFADRGCCVVSTTDLYCRILGFLDRSRYFFFQAFPQLYSRGRVDPVPDPLLLRKSGSAGNWTRHIWICSQELWPLDHRGDRQLLHRNTNCVVYLNVGVVPPLSWPPEITLPQRLWITPLPPPPPTGPFRSNSKLWEERIAYFLLIRLGPHRLLEFSLPRQWFGHPYPINYTWRHM